jgi:pimeloyl-ACP methyl ester carboxylesterase
LEPPRLAGTPLSAFLARVQSPERNWRPDDQALSIILANFEIVEADGDSPEIDDPRMNPAASEETLASERIYPRLSYEHHMQIVRAMWEFPTYKRFRSVDCPVLLLPARPPQPQSQHERDFLAAKERGVAKIQQIQPAAQVQWIEDSIHDIPLQRPAELADEILRFLHAVGE